MSLSAIRNLDYVMLICDDLVVMREFYEGTMGFSVHLETPSWIEMRVGSSILGLARRGRPFEGTPVPSSATSVQLAFRVTPDEVTACHEELSESGAEIIHPPKDEDLGPWVHRYFFFKDPESNLLEIYSDLPHDYVTSR